MPSWVNAVVAAAGESIATTGAGAANSCTEVVVGVTVVAAGVVGAAEVVVNGAESAACTAGVPVSGTILPIMINSAITAAAIHGHRRRAFGVGGFGTIGYGAAGSCGKVIDILGEQELEMRLGGADPTIEQTAEFVTDCRR